tara:strand:+ start:1548 stop:1898 length:351 start_codon:yes stop_codon:yes gene_type:complete
MILIMKHKEYYKMNCYSCGTELIWGGDHDSEDDEEHAIVSNLSCPDCGAFHLVYWGHKGEEEDKQLWIKGYKEWLDNKKEEPEMWEHYCDTEKSMMEVGKGEPCNWCGKEENESNP